MPLYTYRCRTCENEFDIQQRMSEEALTDCPACGQPQLRKVVNSVGVVFKGNGFYVTDNRNGGAAKSANGNGSNGKSESGETQAETPAKEASAKKTETTPATTTDSTKSSGSSEKVAATAV